eukprot:CAMPEP_0201285104 /NCGR_PEP_ID=MMETSP1317-20130820/94841_1 /ASSEMBLY_ACC=CAM_ASM_000770 /TAXON_ID=187299 /ORGANISM="Undescribed Undescribed, Strain Undescribed" /LENGTH=78 /DNA_ID=CAMNT_0047608215 /DNA_START=49 /DNA_END=285 /DNA_ORIENTATION=-
MESLFQNNSDDIESIVVLTTAYNNYGVELEYTKRGLEAIAMFRKAFEMAVFKLGPMHPHAKALKGKLEAASRKYEFSP